MLLRLGRLKEFTGEVIVDRWDAGGHRMAPGDALHRRQPGKGEGVGQILHADIGVDEHVGLVRGNALPGRQQVLG